MTAIIQNFASTAPVSPGPVLVLGATGKTGSRIATKLRKRGISVRDGSRAAARPFDWDKPEAWPALLDGVKAVYLNYAPDLAIPGAAEAIETFTGMAVLSGVERIVLLSGRGEEEAQRSERIVQRSGLDWTVVRASWFAQNFSEGAFLPMVLAGEVALPAGDIPEPFIDIDDIADVAVAALTEDGHASEVYEVTGPRLLTFAEAVDIISTASKRSVRYTQISHEVFLDGVYRSNMPEEVAWLLDYLFSTVLDGRNAHICDGVERALGRRPRDFADFAAHTATSGLWSAAA